VGTGSPQVVGLSGSAQTLVQFYPGTLQFGEQPVNVASPQITVFDENYGTTSVTLGHVSL
jgi:hypothetical protein